MNKKKATVRPVESRRDFEAFLSLPWKIYRDDPMWVPPMKSSARNELKGEKNPFLRHCDYKLFILVRDGEVVGRIAALVDHLAIKAWGQDIGMFAYFECALDDEEGAAEGSALLLGTARDWLRSAGMKIMRGPWTFMSQEWGLVVEGFEPEPVIMAPYNPPGYADLLEAFGLTKAKDLLCWELSVPDGYVIPERILTLTDSIAERYGLSVRTMDVSRFEEEVALFAKLSLTTLENNWGISPITDEEVAALAKDLRSVLVQKCVLFAHTAEGRDVGFALSIPDINKILKKTRGRMLPFGWLRLLWGIPRLRHYRMFALGVAKDFHGKGVDALLYRAMWERMAEPNVTMEINYVLEDNAPMVNAITKLGARPSRRYRVYEIGI
jgi:GNAT superfamily N-acetyltransferase